MDQEQPAVWPPAPQGMEPTPRVNPFKLAPTVWVLLLITVTTVLNAVSSVMIFTGHGSSQFANLMDSLASCFQLAAYVAFLVWFYRVYKNLSLFEVRGLSYTPGWAVAWFFIPIMNLYQPYKIAQVVWKASTPDENTSDSTGWKRGRGGILVGVWWSVTIISQIVLAIPTADAYQSHSLGAGYYEGLGCGDLCAAGAGIATIFLVRAVTARQTAKALTLFAPSENVA